MQGLGTQIVEFDIADRSYKVISSDDFYQSEMNPRKIYWIHYDLSNMTDFDKMVKKINLSDDANHLCRSHSHIPKLIDLNQTVLLKFQSLTRDEFKKNKEERFGNLIIYLTDNYCFTASRYALPALIDFQEMYSKAINYAKTPCFILFLVLDNVVNGYAKMLFNFEIIADELDLEIREADSQIYTEVNAIKHRAMEIKRRIVSLREILMRLSGRSIEVISEDCRVSLMNLNNHCQMVYHEIESIRDILNGLLNQADYALTYRMNNTMRVLTAFAAIFLPLTLITGIYGMNFQYMPELSWRYGYYIVLLLIVLCGLVLFYIFKRLKWF